MSNSEYIFSIFLFFVVIFITFNTQYSDNDLIFGKWVGTYQGNKIEMNFYEDNQFNFVSEDKVSEFTNTLKGNFFADFSKKPVPLSFKNIKGLGYPLHTIIKFKGDDILIMERFSKANKLRPTSFNSSVLIVLNRKQ